MITLPNGKDKITFISEITGGVLEIISGKGIFWTCYDEKCKINEDEIAYIDVEMPGFLNSPRLEFVYKDKEESITVYFKKKTLEGANEIIEACRQNGIRIVMERECDGTYLQDGIGGRDAFLSIEDGKLFYYSYGKLYEIKPENVASVTVKKGDITFYDENSEIIELEKDNLFMLPAIKKKHIPALLEFGKNLERFGFTVKYEI